MKKILQACLLGCLIFSPVFSSTTKTQPDRVELGKRHKKNKSTQKNENEYNINKSVAKSSVYSYHPLYYIKDIGASGKTLSTYDETIWEVSYSDSYIAKTWNRDDPVVITPNYSWFSSHDYLLKNMTYNESIAVNLSQGPFVENAIFITDINSYHGLITLSNGSVWTTGYLYSNDSVLKNWKVGQAILIGESDNWFSPDFILININENNYATVDFYQQLKQ